MEPFTFHKSFAPTSGSGVALREASLAELARVIKVGTGIMSNGTQGTGAVGALRAEPTAVSPGVPARSVDAICRQVQCR